MMEKSVIQDTGPSLLGASVLESSSTREEVMLVGASDRTLDDRFASLSPDLQATCARGYKRALRERMRSRVANQ